jgi:hypothetical protein
MSTFPRQADVPYSDARVVWLVPERVIYVWSAGEITPGVRDWMNTQVIYLYHSCANPKIHLFINRQDVTRLSKATRRDQPAIWHQRRSWCVTVGALSSTPARILANAMLTLLRVKVRDFGSNEAALHFLQQADPTLPDLAPYWQALKA